MKKICIPVLLREYSLLLFISIVIPKLFMTSNVLYMVPIPFLLLIYFILSLFVKCPKCEKCLIFNKHGMTRPPLLHCDKCGQNLMKCEIE